MVAFRTRDLRVTKRYDEGESPPAPVLPITLYAPTRRKKISLEAKVDTGFSGSVAITTDKYVELGLQLYEEPTKVSSGRLVTGTLVPLRVSKGILELGSDRVACEVYTTPLLSKQLLGRELLNRWRIVLDGPRKALRVELSQKPSSLDR